MQGLGRIDIFAIFETQILAIDKQMDFGRITFRFQTLIKFGKFNWFNLWLMWIMNGIIA